MIEGEREIPMDSNGIGKGIATLGICGGAVGLVYIFASFNMLDGVGAGLIILGAFILTAGLWKF